MDNFTVLKKLKVLILDKLFWNKRPKIAVFAIMASNSDSEEKESLSKIFQEGLDLYNHLGKIDEPTNSPSVQVIPQKQLFLQVHFSLF